MNVIGLALLLVVGQASPPIPRQVSANTSGERHQGQQQRETQKQPTNTPLVQNVERSESRNNSSENRATHDESYRVFVERLPEKGGWDKLYVLATVALVMAGFATFGVVWYQAAKTRDAAEAALSAAKVAVKQMQITIERERPRISVEVERVRLKELTVSGVSYVVDCWCPTPAFIVDAWAYLGFNLGVNEKPFWRMGIPIGQRVRGTTKVSGRIELMKPIPKETIKEIEAGDKVLFFCGAISYRGVHLVPDDPSYRTSFRWRWNARDFSDDPELGIDFSDWVRDGKPQENERT